MASYNFNGAAGTLLSAHLPAAVHSAINSSGDFDVLQLDGNGNLVNSVAYSSAAFIFPNANSITVSISANYATNSVALILKSDASNEGYIGKLTSSGNNITHLSLAKNGGYAGSLVFPTPIDYTAGDLKITFAYDTVNFKLVAVVTQNDVEVSRKESAVLTDILTPVSAGVKLSNGVNVSYIENDLPEPVMAFNTLPSVVNAESSMSFSIDTTELLPTVVNSTVTLGGGVLPVTSITSVGSVFTYTCSVPRDLSLVFGSGTEISLTVGTDTITNSSVDYQPSVGKNIVTVDSYAATIGHVFKDFDGLVPEDGGFVIFEKTTNILGLAVDVLPSGKVLIGGDITEEDTFTCYYMSPLGVVGDEATYTMAVDTAVIPGPVPTTLTFTASISNLPASTYSYKIWNTVDLVDVVSGTVTTSSVGSVSLEIPDTAPTTLGIILYHNVSGEFKGAASLSGTVA